MPAPMDKHDAPSYRDESLSLSSLYGMTPKVEAAVITALAEGKTQRVRALVAPLHPRIRPTLWSG